MELRYLGFDQSQNARFYRFDGVEGAVTRQYVVTTDIRLFRVYDVGIQEGPGLCARKLAADLRTSPSGAHELTTEDLRLYAEKRATAAALKSRPSCRRPPRRKARPVSSQSPWRIKQE
jgi:hypothetical protein